MLDPEREKFFLPYQVKWLNDPSRFKAWEKSRQIGASYATAYEDVQDCILGKWPAIWVTSKNQSTALEYIGYCRFWANVFNIVAEASGLELLENKTPSYSLRFANGTKITALSSNADAIRGKRGKFNLDEFDFHKDQDELYKIAFAATLWGFPIRIFSTVNEEEGTRFDLLIKDIKAGALPDFTHHYTDIDIAVDQGLADKIEGRKLTDQERAQFIEKIKVNCLSLENFNQEFKCIRIGAKNRFISYQQLQAIARANYCPIMTLEDIEKPDQLNSEGITKYLKALGKQCYAGFDIARKKHFSVIWLFEKVGYHRHTRAVWILKNCHFRVQEELAAIMLRTGHLQRLCIDATGLGSQIAENLETDFPNKVEGIVFNLTTKSEMAWRSYASIEDKSVTIPKDDDVTKDFRSIRKYSSTGNKDRFDVEGSDTDGHADRWWAFCLADTACEKTSGPITDCIGSTRPRETRKLLEGY